MPTDTNTTQSPVAPEPLQNERPLKGVTDPCGYNAKHPFTVTLPISTKVPFPTELPVRMNLPFEMALLMRPGGAAASATVAGAASTSSSSTWDDCGCREQEASPKAEPIDPRDFMSPADRDIFELLTYRPRSRFWAAQQAKVRALFDTRNELRAVNASAEALVDATRKLGGGDACDDRIEKLEKEFEQLAGDHKALLEERHKLLQEFQSLAEYVRRCCDGDQAQAVDAAQAAEKTAGTASRRKGAR
jgi:hypothetical protein